MMNLENIDSEDLIQELLKRGYIRALWHRDDVIIVSEDMGLKLEEDEIDNIVDDIEHKFDANMGVNWDIIQYRISSYVNKTT